MNNNQLSGLDPKVQETYHRVMSTPTQPAQPVQTSPPAQPTAPPPAAPPAGQSPLGSAPPAQAEAPVPQQIYTPSTAVSEPPPTLNVTNSQVFSSKKKAGHISPVVMIMGIAVFFVVYALVWVKIFNARLPFLP